MGFVLAPSSGENAFNGSINVNGDTGSQLSATGESNPENHFSSFRLALIYHDLGTLDEECHPPCWINAASHH